MVVVVLVSFHEQWLSDCRSVSQPDMTRLFRLVASVDRMGEIRSHIVGLDLVGRLLCHCASEFNRMLSSLKH